MKNARTNPDMKQSAFAEHGSFQNPNGMLRPPARFLSQFVGVSA